MNVPSGDVDPPMRAGDTTLSVDKQTANLREMVVFLDGHTDNSGMLDFAALIAELHDARLIGVFMQPQPTIRPEEAFARGTGMREVSEAHRAQLEGIEGGQRAVFDDVTRRHGILSEWRCSPHFSTDVTGHAHYADLVVVTRPDPKHQTAGPSEFVESLVLTSGRPIITLPPGGIAPHVRRILVGWNASREAVRAVSDSMPFLVKAEAVEVLIIDPQINSAHHGPEPGADIARHLAHHGAKVEVRRLSTEGQDVGRVLLSEAAAFGADLVVMGAYGHSRLRDWVFGGVTRLVLREAAVPVLMSR